MRRRRVRDVVVDQAAHAGELAQRVEVADERHPRVGVRAVRFEELLRRREHAM
jgi:hypothetical protein